MEQRAGFSRFPQSSGSFCAAKHPKMRRSGLREWGFISPGCTQQKRQPEFLVALKAIADKARNYAGEIPSKIPKDGFRDLDNFEYPEPLTIDEIRAVIMADMERRNLLELFAAGEGIRKAGIQ